MGLTGQEALLHLLQVLALFLLVLEYNHIQDVDTGSNSSYTDVATGSNTSYSDASIGDKKWLQHTHHLGIELQATGENAGTWGTKTNTNLQLIEQIAGGFIQKSIAGGAQTTALAVSDGSIECRTCA